VVPTPYESELGVPTHYPPPLPAARGYPHACTQPRPNPSAATEKAFFFCGGVLVICEQSKQSTANTHANAHPCHRASQRSRLPHMPTLCPRSLLPTYTGVFVILVLTLCITVHLLFNPLKTKNMRGKNLITGSFIATKDQMDKQGTILWNKGEKVYTYSYAIDFTQSWDAVQQKFVQVTPEQADADKQAVLNLENSKGEKWAKEENGVIRVKTTWNKGATPEIFINGEGKLTFADKLRDLKIAELREKEEERALEIEAKAQAHGLSTKQVSNLKMRVLTAELIKSNVGVYQQNDEQDINFDE